METIHQLEKKVENLELVNLQNSKLIYDLN
jgi:hypothetical protein